MRDGGSILRLMVPGWDFGAKVPARTGAVNDGADRCILRPDQGLDASCRWLGWAPGLVAT
ncbi:hypothetical protein XH89_34680 [Bradyrhizobium sp. CCBAU 53340]|nr:hypothetical protein XH89_34680 [Bradyrhizobium sp. CCBAU 53340]